MKGRERSVSRVESLLSQGAEEGEGGGAEVDGWIGEEGKDAWVLFDFEGEKDGNEL